MCLRVESRALQRNVKTKETGQPLQLALYSYLRSTGIQQS